MTAEPYCYWNLPGEIRDHEKFFTVYGEMKHVKALCCLIVSNHTLRVEYGRWERPPLPRERRFCYHCFNKLEDEFQFVLECPKYHNTRMRLIPRYYWQRPSMFKMVELINSGNRNVIIGLAKFIFLATKERSVALLYI